MKNKTHSKGRRNFIRKSTFAFAAATAASSLSLSAEKINWEAIPKGTTILLQGDSITDAGRDKARYYANEAAGMGRGYAYQIVSQMLGTHPKSELRFYNRGISGHKVFQLANRWEDDCLQLKPDVLSILIGVNDFWHTLGNRYDGTVEVYEKDLRKLLDRTKKALPNVKLMIGEPFAVAGGTAIGPVWNKDFPALPPCRQESCRGFIARSLSLTKASSMKPSPWLLRSTGAPMAYTHPWLVLTSWPRLGWKVSCPYMHKTVVLNLQPWETIVGGNIMVASIPT